jgi:hypothetical protein
MHCKERLKLSRGGRKPLLTIILDLKFKKTIILDPHWVDLNWLQI